MSKNANIEFVINSQVVDFALETFDIEIKSSFDNDNIQPTISVDELTIFGDGVDIIKNWVTIGNYYKGLPIKINISDNNGQRSIFDGYINLPKHYEVFDDNTVKVAITKKNGMNSVNERLASITWDLLVDKGIVTNSHYSDVDYVVEKSNNGLDIIVLLITIFILTKELIESIDRISDNVNKVITSAIPAVGVGAVSMVGQIIYASLSLILMIIYTALILFAIVKMSLQLFEILIHPSRTHKCINYRTGLQILSTHLGFNFSSPILELDNYYYLPSNVNVDVVDGVLGSISTPKGVSVGVPHSNDYGFTGFEFFNIILTQFEAKIAIIGTDLVLRAKNDPFWKKQATYKMPDIDVEVTGTNANDLVFSTLIKYETDPIADEYTLSNYSGTNYQILVNDNSVVQGADDNFIRKHETIDFRLALGNRKDELNSLEKTAKILASVIDNITGIFGGGTNLSSKVKNRVGLLKVGTNNHTKAKCLYLVGGKLPVNHRALTSARYLWNKYINYISFVTNGKIQQKAVIKLKNVPFGMGDFLKTVDNGYFLTTENEEAKIEESKWNVLEDTAEINFKKPYIFAPNLYETYIEAV